MNTSSKNYNEGSEWIVVQPGLFNYPLAGDEKPVLLANQCTSCRSHFFPRRLFCPNCFENGSMEDTSLERRGIVYASTVVQVPSPVGITPPYAYGYVDMAASRIRVFALFTGAIPSSFRPGQEVELVVEPLYVNSQGQQVIGYKFKPVS